MAVRLKDHLNDPVTRHMRPEFAGLRAEQTVAEALAALRAQPPAGRILYFYVLDAGGRLQGVIPTRRLLLSAPDQPVADLMVRHVVAVPAAASVLDACEFFTLHRLLAFPVVDEQRRLLGVVDVDLYTEGLSEAGGGEDDAGVVRGDDLFQLIGVRLAQARPPSLAAAFRSRLPWLLCSLGGGVAAALLSWLYRSELQRTVAVALFIPVVLGLAESMGIQSVSLALQALHGPPPGRAFLPRLRRELATGLALGAACGLAVAALAAAWLGEARVGLSLLGGIAGGVTGAAGLGLALPHLLRRLRLDPRVAAGPVALALADTLSILLYLNLARWLLP